ncbi:hypothetical protein CTA2_12064 [Colletotrichum tanaceti]|uniref:Uncharacterized protein n=1 Tax=Colletotrichum tanaceti TaxID=1306861 RepID=A0A4U6X1L4_9PEZI|nr:hypothetical protein CTA2_12064 [Colletotrichum tanaceti]TKW48894.1 hypothetical protein CTA1_4418 [Colletotrichum tanaceti]
MFPCVCGRRFGSEAALTQHQTDRDRATRGRAPCRPSSGMASSLPNLERSSAGTAARTGNTHPPFPRNINASKNAWLWKKMRNPAEPVYTITQTGIVPSDTQVSSKAGYQLLCSYNWQEGKPARIRVPGYAAIWKGVTLPLTISPDEGTFFIDQNTALMPQHPFEPMFRAAAAMGRDVSFDDVDVVTNRNSLRKLLDFCSPRSQESFRLHLHLVRDTLIIERCEKHTREFVAGSTRGWGRNFEKASTAFPPNLTESHGHHRTLRYALGALECAVQFEVDASFDPDYDEPAASKEPDVLGLAMEKLSIQAPKPATDNGARDLQVETAYRGARVMSQSTAAEIKSAAKTRPLGWRMPQLWFGRTPWLIVGQHADGTFHDVKVTDAAAHFAEWEATHQTALRKLAAVLGELRAAVRGNGGRRCAAVFEKGSGAIRVFDLTSDGQAVPRDLREKLWT